MSWLREKNVDILEYLPAFLASDTEFKTLSDALSKEHETVRVDIHRLLQELFVDLETSYGLAKWESVLEMSPPPDATEDERRRSIILRLQSKSVSTLAFMGTLTGRYMSGGETHIEEENEKYMFKIVTSGTIEDKRGLKEALDLYKPAHLGYSFLYNVFDLDDEPIGDTTVHGDELVEGVTTWWRDDVPYGHALDYPRYDGTHRIGGMRTIGSGKADGSIRLGDVLPGTLQVREGIDWQFVYDGPAFFDGTFKADGTVIANGQRPWKLQYNDFMDTLSLLVITMRKPDGTTQLEDDVAATLKIGEGIKACGGAQIGKTQLPVDNCGRLEIMRAHKYDGSIRIGEDLNKTDGSIKLGESFQIGGGGYHPGFEHWQDELCGTLNIVKPKKHPPLALRYPELHETVEPPDERDETSALLSGFEDSPGISETAFKVGDGFKADGAAMVGAGNLLPADAGGEITIIKAIMADGSHQVGYGMSYKADGTVKVGSGAKLKGGNQFGIIRRHGETL